MPGSPPPLENRTVARTGPPWRCAARDKREAAGAGVNVPASSVPFACAARWPSCSPETSLIACTACSASVSAMPATLLRVGHSQDGELDVEQLVFEVEQVCRPADGDAPDRQFVDRAGGRLVEQIGSGRP